jgi:hypothetical protein
LVKAKVIAKGISEIPENKKGHLVDSYHLSDMPEAMESTSSDEEHNSGLVSKYQVKSREPNIALNQNEPAPSKEFPEFRVKVRTDRERIKELQKTMRQLKKEKGTYRTMECSSARKDSKFQEEEEREKGIAQRAQRNKLQTLLAQCRAYHKAQTENCQSYCCYYILKVS